MSGFRRYLRTTTGIAYIFKKKNSVWGLDLRLGFGNAQAWFVVLFHLMISVRGFGFLMFFSNYQHSLWAVLSLPQFLLSVGVQADVILLQEFIKWLNII